MATPLVFVACGASLAGEMARIDGSDPNQAVQQESENREIIRENDPSPRAGETDSPSRDMPYRQGNRGFIIGLKIPIWAQYPQPKSLRGTSEGDTSPRPRPVDGHTAPTIVTSDEDTATSTTNPPDLHQKPIPEGFRPIPYAVDREADQKTPANFHGAQNGAIFDESDSPKTVEGEVVPVSPEEYAVRKVWA